MISLVPFILLGILVLPNWLLLILGVTLVRLDQTPLLSLGDADIRIHDLLILATTLKVGCFIAVSRQRVYTSLYQPIMAFLAVLLGATILIYVRFESEVFKSEIVAFLRFLGLFVIFFLTAHSLLTIRKLELAIRCLNLIGYIAAATVYLGLALFMIGIEFGEVSVGEVIRTFGIFGDQIGFILPLFLYKELLDHKALRASFFGVAILLTGTRGALITSMVGLVFMYLFSQLSRDFLRQHYKTFIPGVIVIVVVTIAFSYDIGSMRARFVGTEIFIQGLTSRMSTFTIATEVFLDNFLTGVGFSGFRFVASDYEAGAIFGQAIYHPSALVATTANQYLQVATDAGILGLVAFLWLMKRCLQVLKNAQAVAPVKLRPSLEAAYIWLLSLLVGAQSIAWLLPDMTLSYILWIIMGMAVAVITIEQESRGVNLQMSRAV